VLELVIMPEDARLLDFCVLVIIHMHTSHLSNTARGSAVTGHLVPAHRASGWRGPLCGGRVMGPGWMPVPAAVPRRPSLAVSCSPTSRTWGAGVDHLVTQAAWCGRRRAGADPGAGERAAWICGPLPHRGGGERAGCLRAAQPGRITSSGWARPGAR
jgi:hypothetical protein